MGGASSAAITRGTPSGRRHVSTLSAHSASGVCVGGGGEMLACA